MDFLYKSTFAAQVRVLHPSDQDKNEAKASINDLKGLLPDDVNPEDDVDLLYIAANLAVAGMVNLNDDGLDMATALDVYKKFEKKQVNIEHNRDNIVGYILRAGLSEVGTDKLITEDEAREANKPFNIATVAVLWRIKAKELCNYLVDASNPLNSDYKALSLSFEMGFNDYSVVALPPGEMDIAKATKTVNPVDKDFEPFNKALRANKGDGLDPDGNGQRVYRIMPKSVIPLGEGIVTMPAAAVKGIVAITQSPIPIVSPRPEVDIKSEDMDDVMSNINKLCNSIDKKDIKTRVLHDIERIIKSSHMNKSDLEQIKLKASKAEKLEDLKEVFAGLTPIMDAISTESERLTVKNKELESQATEIAKAKEDAITAYTKLNSEFAALKKQLDEIKATQTAAELQDKFNERMASIDDVFELDNDERALIVAEIKDQDDETFAKSMDKFKKLMKEKTKAYKKSAADMAKKKSDEMCAALAAKGLTLTVDETTLDFKEILASAQQDIISPVIPNLINTNLSIKDMAKAAFEGTLFGGKKMDELTKKE